jgi:formylglycine-generating enzyme required for sulfatase activity
MLTADATLERDAVLQWYLRNRARTAELFDLLSDDAYYQQPIHLRHPIVFYEGHLPAFSLNTLVKKGLGRPGVDEHLERLFARGIDPDTSAEARSSFQWPDRRTVRQFVAAADALVIDALQHAELERPGHPLLDRGEAVYAILEHEAMHQETLLYMWHRLPHEQKRAPRGYSLATGAVAVDRDAVAVPAGVARLGAERGEIPFGWDNEFGPVVEDVAAFVMDRVNVTNGDFLEFIRAQPGAASSVPAFWEQLDGEWLWRGMFERIPLPLDWPVYVSHDAATAYAQWRGKRLATEAEFHRAAYGSDSDAPRPYPWGDAEPDATRGVFDFASWEPHPVGSHPLGRSAWGIDDLVGNGWEWTSSVFRPFPGFRAMASYPEYSADFFDDSHYVMKGASPATARELLRPTFRNWFRPRYPYVYATFRCVEDR